MHADHYSIPATTKGKRLHPLAIKARGCTALEKGKGGHKKKGRGKKKQKGERQQKNTQRRGRIMVDWPESAPQAATTSTSTKQLQRGKNIVDRGNKRNKEKKQCRNNREEEERPQQHHRPIGHWHHCQLIYPSSSSQQQPHRLPSSLNHHLEEEAEKQGDRKRSNAETKEMRKSDRSNTTAQPVTSITVSSSIQAHHPR